VVQQIDFEILLTLSPKVDMFKLRKMSPPTGQQAPDDFFIIIIISPRFFGASIFSHQEEQQHLGDTRQMLPRKNFLQDKTGGHL
jgi:hypothetical protein